jgi:sigma-B regulation protein RsbU (phosphoserine phosphatase)
MRLPLEAQRLIIGRSSDSDVRLEGVTVSRHQAEIVRDPFGRLWVGDLKSQNGTKVNGRPITTHRLTAGDCIQIGAYELRVESPRTDTEARDSADVQSLTLLTDAPGRLTSLLPNKKARLSAAHLSKLMELSRSLASIADPGGRMTALCTVFLNEPFGGRMSVALRVPGKDPDAAEPLCAQQVAPDMDPKAVYISRSLLRAVAEQQRPLLASNVSAGPVDISLSLAPDAQAVAAIACPIRLDVNAIDVLVVTLPPDRGTADWLALASLAVEHYQHAELVWAARHDAESHAAVERELDRAREIQRRFLPIDVHVDGLDYTIDFRPCLWVGGDYVDVVPLPDGRALLVVADVSGKGLHAALIASSLHATLHVLCEIHTDLAMLIGLLNEYLCRHLQARSFVTMVCALLDPKTGQFDYVNAGHPPALVIGPGRQARPVAVPADIPLGIDPRKPTSHRGTLDRGQALAMFSDGLTEIRLDGGEFLDIGGLSSHLVEVWEDGLSTAEITTRFTNRMQQFQQASLPADDQTLLIARRL